MIYEIEFENYLHTIRVSDAMVMGNMAGLKSEYWGKDAWMPAGHVIGRDDDSIDVAISRGVDESLESLAA